MEIYIIVIDMEAFEHMERPVTKDEVIYVLKEMGRGKSHGFDGWTIELFLHFQYIMIDELTKMVEESRIHGWVSATNNATFIILILKIDKPDFFLLLSPNFIVQHHI